MITTSNHPIPTKRPEASVIVAMTRDRIIGHHGKVPWHLPEDLQLFKELTTGTTVVMGRRTYESIGHPLPQRQNIVISRTLPMQKGITVCRDFEEGLTNAWRFGRPVFFIGGAEIYSKGLQIAEHLHISWIDDTFQGDTHFPSFDLEQWQLQSEQPYRGFRYCHYRHKSSLPERSPSSL